MVSEYLMEINVKESEHSLISDTLSTDTKQARETLFRTADAEIKFIRLPLELTREVCCSDLNNYGKL